MPRLPSRSSIDWLVRDPRGRLKRLRLRLTVTAPRTALQKRRLTRSSDLSAPDRDLLSRTDSRIHPYEDMYTGDGRQYFLASLVAIRAINRVLAEAGAASPGAILDMPCGFGRVMRSLVSCFPAATVTACDIRARAVKFCARRFDAEGVVSSRAFDQMSFARRFDLIWCGSLVTHLDPTQAAALLDLFARSASPGGIVVFTTHGDPVAREIRAGANYMLPPDGVRSLMRSYERSGYGYVDYPWESGYGVAVTSSDWMRDHVEGRGGLREVYFAEGGWGGGQDVYGFIKT